MLGVSSSVVSKFAQRKPDIEMGAAIAQSHSWGKKYSDEDKIAIIDLND